MSIYIQVSVKTCIFIFCVKIPTDRIARRYGKCMLNLQKIANLFSKAALPFCIALINNDAEVFFSFVFYMFHIFKPVAGPEPEDGPYSDWWLGKWTTPAKAVVSQ